MRPSPALRATEHPPALGSAPAHGEPITVTASDGARLHAEVGGNPRAPVTVLLCHGYLVNNQSWQHQWASLGRQARVVSYDHRGHGRSEAGSLTRMTLDQLGRDLLAVLEHPAQESPVILVGHSMGGMAIMALAEQHPEIFGDRVAGVALLTTSAGPVNGTVRLPPAVANMVLSAIEQLRLTSACCRVLRHMALFRARSWVFSSRVPPTLVDFVLQLTRSSPVHALAALIPQFLTLNKFPALQAFNKVRTLVVAAGQDETIAPEHSTAIARAISGARLETIENAGHMVIVEHPRLVNGLLRDLIARVSRDRGLTSGAVPRGGGRSPRSPRRLPLPYKCGREKPRR